MITNEKGDNDYAVAKAFNNCVLGIIAMIVLAEVVEKQEDADMHELNRVLGGLTSLSSLSLIVQKSKSK